MLQHILVALDGSPLSERAIDYAHEIIGAGGTVTLLRVVTPDEEADETSDAPPAEQARQYLEEKSDKFREKDIQTDIQVASGDPAQLIVIRASELNVDAIVMCTHGRTGIQRWIHGSVTQGVMRQMPCPVVVVPGYDR
jgi:nucleotide-binding universal stress UspA family protein